jgi:hypothetical protein
MRSHLPLMAQVGRTFLALREDGKRLDDSSEGELADLAHGDR